VAIKFRSEANNDLYANAVSLLCGSLFSLINYNLRAAT